MQNAEPQNQHRVSSPDHVCLGTLSSQAERSQPEPSTWTTAGTQGCSWGRKPVPPSTTPTRVSEVQPGASDSLVTAHCDIQRQDRTRGG